MRVAVSGVNPTDWKSRGGNGPGEGPAFPEVVPNQDGAGTVVAVGPDVDAGRVGQRVWLWEAAWQRADGTAQELVVLPATHAIALPEEASFDLGASLGIPAMTAHRCLTVGSEGPTTLGARRARGPHGPGRRRRGRGRARRHRTGGLGWRGGHHHGELGGEGAAGLGGRRTSRRELPDPGRGAGGPFAVARDGVDLIVEVAPVQNAALDAAVIARDGTVAIYASGTEDLAIAVRPAMTKNVRYQFVLVYTMPVGAKEQALQDVQAAAADGALRVGTDAGLPLHRFPLDRTADAHAAVEANAVGKVLIDVG